MAGRPENVTLRPVRAEDEPFLFEVYSSTRKDEMALTGWDDAQQRAFLKMQFAAQQLHYTRENPAADHRIILLDGNPVGRVYVSRKEDEIRLLDITVLPEYRNRGIGAPIIRDVMREAAGEGKSVTIYVETFNPSLRLFERLGFSREAEQGIHFFLRWDPSA
jgi:ribosomal protein S18 acetylase RimI-like enzyme